MPSRKDLWILMLRAISLASLVYAAETAAADAPEPSLRRGYVEGRFGQMHYFIARPLSGEPTRAPIAFFHQNPKSGLEYEHLLRDLGRDRVVIAIDTPGYGGSDRPPEPPTMEQIAGSMADALEALGYGQRGGGRVDVFGFHTGAYIAAELALQRPDLVQRVVLSGVAYKTPAERLRLLEALPSDYAFPEDGTRLLNRWYRIVIQREPGVTLQRAQRLFHEDVKALGYWWFAYRAVWNWPVEERLPRLEQPVLILEPHEMLLDDTRRAHRDLLPRAAYVELPEIRAESRVFETGAPLFAREMRRWLDR